MLRSGKEKTLSYVVFGIYSALLIWLVLFKFSVDLSELPSIRGINLIPFYYDRETGMHLREVVYNIIVFVPLGVYVQILAKHLKSVAKLAAILSVSLLFEVVQYIFAIGASDITDIIGNTLGGVLGIFLCVLTKKIAPQKYILIFNILGILIETAAVVLLVLLMVSNG